MYQNDHGPVHFHVRYQGRQVSVELATLQITQGDLPAPIRRQVLRWARHRESELERAWQQVSAYERPDTIAPLD